MAPQGQQRASITAEIRAWVGVGIALFVNTVGLVWWAATLSAEVRATRELLDAQRTIYLDHETRIRALEQKKPQ